MFLPKPGVCKIVLYPFAGITLFLLPLSTLYMIGISFVSPVAPVVTRPAKSILYASNVSFLSNTRVVPLSKLTAVVYLSSPYIV